MICIKYTKELELHSDFYKKSFKGKFFTRLNINSPLHDVPSYTSHYHGGFFLTHFHLSPTES